MGSRCSPIPSASPDTGEEITMDLTALLLSRLQFAFTVSFHIIFPSFRSVLARMSGPIQGPLLSYETFTAFFLEASFFGILLFGRPRVPPWFYLFSTAMVALGTTLSAYWIMANNSWMQVPVGYVMENGAFAPDDWLKI